MFKRVKENALLKSTRKKKVSRFEDTELWAALKKDLDRGLKTRPAREALQAVLTPELKKSNKITNRRVFARFIQKYIDESGYPYTVHCFISDGLDVVQIRAN